MTSVITLFVILYIRGTITSGQAVQNNIAADSNPHNATPATVGDNKYQNIGAFVNALEPTIGQYIFSAIGRGFGAALNCTVSGGALSDTLMLFGLLQNQKDAMTAFRYIDASSKIPNGIIEGNFQWVGKYTECVERIEPIFNTISKRYFKGKYFTVIIGTNGTGFLPHPIMAPRGTEIKMGLCLPDSYSKEDTKCALNMAFSFLENLNQTASVLKPLNIRASQVYTDDEEILDGGAITALVISGIIVTLILVGTAIDLIFPKIDSTMTLLDGEKNSKGNPSETVHDSTVFGTEDPSGLLEKGMAGKRMQNERLHFVRQNIFGVLRAFSFIRNAKKLLNTSTAKSPLACLNGMRVLSMWWVILGHVYLYSLFILDNPVEAITVSQRFSFQPIGNATFSVDTFFFLSGLLVAYLTLKEVKEKGRVGGCICSLAHLAPWSNLQKVEKA